MSSARGEARTWLLQTAPLGDLILTLPLVDALFRTVAGDGIVLVVRRGHEELAAQIPGVVAAIDRDSARDRVRKSNVDLLVSAHRSFRSGRLARSSAAGTRIGFNRCWGRWGWDRSVPRRMDLPAPRRYLELLEPLGVDPDGQPDVPRLPPGPAESALADAWLLDRGISAGDRFVAFAPGAAWGTKRWPADRFRAWARAQNDAGRKVVAFGTAAERTLCDTVTQGLPAAISAGGETSLPELAAVLRRASLFLGNDSGTGHLAAAVGTPVVSLFGPTVPAMGFAPQGAGNRIVEVEGLRCRPCHRHGPERCPRSHFRCMLDLAPERVISVTDAVWQSAVRSPAADRS